MTLPTAHDYEALALALATNPQKLKQLREKLKRKIKTAPLYDTKLFTKHIQGAYTQMYDRYHDGLEPDHFYVEP